MTIAVDLGRKATKPTNQPTFHLDIYYSLGLIKHFPCEQLFYCLLMAFANSFDPGQFRQNVDPDLGKTVCHRLIVFL